MADFFNLSFVNGPGQDSWVVQGASPAGTDITLQWTGVTVTSPCGQYGYACNADSQQTTQNNGEARFPVSTPSGSATFRTTQNGTAIVGAFYTDHFCSGGTVAHLSVTWSTPVSNYCQYGTEPQPNSQLTYYLTPAQIALWLTPVDLEWLAPIFAPMWYQTINVADLCANPPPPTPTLDLSTLDASVATVRNILNWIAWPALCQCSPGSPAPIPFPPPSGAEPPGWPTAPTVNCSNTDLCSLLVQVAQLLQAMNAQLGENLGLTTLLQRHKLPFAFIRGSTHSALVGTGSLAIPTGLVGLEVQVHGDTVHRQLFGVPPYVWDLGWVSVNDGGAMLQEKRIARDRFQWFPQSMELAAQVGYALKGDISIDLTELEPEP